MHKRNPYNLIKATGIMMFLFFMTACSPATYTTINSEQAKNMIESKQVEVIDVRSQEEYQDGHIENVRLIPLQEIEGRISELNPDQSYLVVCRSGNRSQKASEILIQKGFKKIYNMASGMNQWPYEIQIEKK